MDRVDRIARALFALHIKDCSVTGTVPSAAAIEQGWTAYSEWMRDAWRKRARYVLAEVDHANAVAAGVSPEETR